MKLCHNEVVALATIRKGTTMTQPAWANSLWAQLEDMSLEDQIINSGDWITFITGDLLVQLGRHRRLAIVEALKGDIDEGVLADRIGGRRTTLQRLAAEGRTIRKHEEAAAA